MNAQIDIFDSLRRLRLPHIADRLAALPMKGKQEAHFLATLGDLLQGEIDVRAQRVHQKRQLDAGLSMPSASLENIWYRSGRNLDRAVVESLANGDYLDRGQHVIVTGASGRGKTWLANALAQAAIRAGRRVLYRDVQELLAEWQAADLAGNLRSFRKRLNRPRSARVGRLGRGASCRRRRPYASPDFARTIRAALDHAGVAGESRSLAPMARRLCGGRVDGPDRERGVPD